MLLINDANILIDFDCCGLLEGLFQIPDELAVPDILFDEELKARHPELPGLGLRVMGLSGTAIDEAVRRA